MDMSLGRRSPLFDLRRDRLRHLTARMFPLGHTSLPIPEVPLHSYAKPCVKAKDLDL